MSAHQSNLGGAGFASSPPVREIPELPAELGATQSPADMQRMRLAVPPPSALPSQDAATHRGAPAGVGARLLAFTIDVLFIALIATGVYLLSKSVPLTVVTALEVVVIVCVIEARTGLTLGNGMLRLRAARADRPYSPGVGREFVRSVVTGLGFLVAIGSWVVVASSAWDRAGKRRSWADRAATTVVIAVPKRGAAVEAAPALPVPPPQIVNTVMRAPEREEDAAVADAAAAAFAAGGQAGHSVEAPVSAPHVGAGLSGLQDAAVPIERGTLLLILTPGSACR